MSWRQPCAGFVLALLLTACGTPTPGPRLDSILGPSEEAATTDWSRLGAGSRVVLVVVQDASGPGAAPALSPRGVEFLAHQTKARLEGALPLTVVAVVSSSDLNRDGREGRLPLQTLASRHQVETVAVAVYSAVEVEDPQPLPLDGNRGGGGAMGRLPGVVTSVFARSDLALVDAASGRRLVQSHGQTSVSLEQLARGMASNAFPAFYREGGSQRIAAPPDSAEAHDALRGLAFDDALEHATYDLSAQWKARPAP